MRKDSLEREINTLGGELCRCGQICAGVHRDQHAGVLPRCLILERQQAKGKGCLVVGINPGRSPRVEREHYIHTGASYESGKQYWLGHVGKIPYYTRLRRFIDQIGLHGPIVWSDLAKCENAPSSKGLLPLQTLRQCAGRFLHREISLLRPSWPLIGVGTEAYKALGYLV